MVTLALASWDIVKSGYNLSVATDQESKVKEMEALILGVTKASSIFCTFTVLYAAYFLVERLDYQLLLATLTFCIHPVAVLDIIGSAAAVYGIFQLGTSICLHRENKKPIVMLANLAREQAKREGYPFYHIRSFKGPEGPPETMNRLNELARELRDKHFDSESWARLVASINTAWEYMISALNYLGISTISWIGTIVVIASESSWLDRKMVDFSKWLAPRIII